MFLHLSVALRSRPLPSSVRFTELRHRHEKHATLVDSEFLDRVIGSVLGLLRSAGRNVSLSQMIIPVDFRNFRLVLALPGSWPRRVGFVAGSVDGVAEVYLESAHAAERACGARISAG